MTFTIIITIINADSLVNASQLLDMLATGRIFINLVPESAKSVQMISQLWRTFNFETPSEQSRHASKLSHKVKCLTSCRHGRLHEDSHYPAAWPWRQRGCGCRARRERYWKPPSPSAGIGLLCLVLSSRLPTAAISSPRLRLWSNGRHTASYFLHGAAQRQTQALSRSSTSFAFHVVHFLSLVLLLMTW